MSYLADDSINIHRSKGKVKSDHWEQKEEENDERLDFSNERVSRRMKCHTSQRTFLESNLNWIHEDGLRIGLKEMNYESVDIFKTGGKVKEVCLNLWTGSSEWALQWVVE